MEKTKILFLITCKANCVGGHFHSLSHISLILSEKYDIRIVSFGLKESPVLKRNRFYQGRVYLKGWNFLQNYRNFRRILKQFDPDIINCFDTESFNQTVLLPFFWKKKIVLTKCGGPNPIRKRWQFAEDLVLFSQENFKWFTDNSYYKNSRLHLIPNRVLSVHLLDHSERKYVKSEDMFNFVRICRIGSRYKDSILKSLSLIKEINSYKPVHLYIIGKVEETQVELELTNIVNSTILPVSFITSESTSNASELLYLADCVIGTGRGIMEAMSLGIPCLTPLMNTQFPVLIDRNNFHNLSGTNFSPRNTLELYDENVNLERIKRMVGDNDFYICLKKEVTELFENHLGPQNAADHYSQVFVTKKRHSALSLIMRNFVYIIRDLSR